MASNTALLQIKSSYVDRLILIYLEKHHTDLFRWLLMTAESAVDEYGAQVALRSTLRTRVSIPAR